MSTATFQRTISPGTIWQDALYALRTMRQKPAFAATAILTMALAIGGNTAMFTVIRAVLLKPLQYRDPDRLVNISEGATPILFAEMKAGHSFTELGAFTSQENITLSGGAEPEVLKGERVSAAFLRILGVEPMLGRGFRPEEDSPGGAPVAMISSELWQRRFAGDPQIVGKTATLASTAYTIIGVLPPRFQFPVPRRGCMDDGAHGVAAHVRQVQSRQPIPVRIRPSEAGIQAGASQRRDASDPASIRGGQSRAAGRRRAEDGEGSCADER